MITITIEGSELSRDGLVDAVVKELIYGGGDSDRLQKCVENALEEKVAEMVEHVADDVTHQRIAQVVDKVLGEGWASTDEWGNEEGPRLDLRKRISGALGYRSRSDRRSHHRYESTALEKAVDDAVGGQIAKVIKAETENIQKILRGIIDEKLSGQVVASLRDAIGLR